jgi:hypothetical protein
VVTSARRARSPIALVQRTQFYFDLREGVRRVRQTGAASERSPRTGRPGARLAKFLGIETKPNFDEPNNLLQEAGEEIKVSLPSKLGIILLFYSLHSTL